MAQIHESRASASPYIQTVWRTQNITDGTYLATPDGSWDLIMGVDKQGRRSMLLTGQATKSVHVPYEAGTSSVVISFTPGAYLPHIAASRLVDVVELLPSVGDDQFKLGEHTFYFPTFETAEELVEHMVAAGVLKNDEIVDGLLKGAPKAASARAVQRHFVQSVGVTHKQLRQIHRAQEGVRLLKQGKKPADVAAEAGYSDQPHLSKSLKRIMDSQPSDVNDIHKL